VQAQNDIAKASDYDINAISNPPAKSGLSYDLLTKFFQANITSGKSGGYDFKATLYGIRQLFTTDSLNSSNYYLKKTSIAERNSEIGTGIHKGKNGDLNLLAVGLKYAIVNKRDKSLFNFFEDPLIREIDHKFGSAAAYADKKYKEKYADKPDKLNLIYKVKFENEPVEWRQYYDDFFTTETGTQLLKKLQNRYDSLSKVVEKKGLLILSFNPEYDWNNSRFDSTSINLQYLKGFGYYKKPWNIDTKVTQLFQHDSNGVKSNMSRYITSATLGINKILACDTKLNPIIEFELAGELDFVESGIYHNEDHTRPKLVTTLRVHITKEISLPVELKYDLKKPNLLGIFRIQWNLENSSGSK